MNNPAETVQYGFSLKMEGISKSFMGISALNNVNLFVKQGEVHALMGENGAGKSTLMKILSGIYQKDTGTILLKGIPVNIKSPKEALRLGISMIHQELNPVSAMTVSENIFLGKEPCYRYTNIVNTKKQHELALSLFHEMDIFINPDAKMQDLSVAEIQLVEIMKAVSYNSDIMIMDEPTSAITEREVNKLFDIIRNLKSKGISIIYISHKMDEIFHIADSITVLRDGQHIDTRPAKELDNATLIKLMVGREISELFHKEKTEKGNMCLQVEGLTKEGMFHDIKFNLYKNQVLGFAGLMGAGRTEIMETLFGINGPFSGSLKIEGREVIIKSPSDAIRHGIALISEDRKLKGLNLKGSVKFNITLATLKRFCKFGQIVQLGEEKSFVDKEIKKLSIKTSDRNQIVNTLSGGNQQKVVLAKWLATDPGILILDEPTRGVDVGAKAEIYKIIGNLAKQGKAIILISSEMSEIIGLCDRVIVLHQGKITAEFQRDKFSQEAIMEAAMG